MKMETDIAGMQRESVYIKVGKRSIESNNKRTCVVKGKISHLVAKTDVMKGGWQLSAAGATPPIKWEGSPESCHLEILEK